MHVPRSLLLSGLLLASFLSRGQGEVLRALRAELAQMTVEHPADQIVNGRRSARARSTSSGRTAARSASICGRLRKKCVSWMVTAFNNACRSAPPVGLATSSR